jgi:hypothetical protein
VYESFGRGGSDCESGSRAGDDSDESEPRVTILARVVGATADLSRTSGSSHRGLAPPVIAERGITGGPTNSRSDYLASSPATFSAISSKDRIRSSTS